MGDHCSETARPGPRNIFSFSQMGGIVKMELGRRSGGGWEKARNRAKDE
jgi:hypothetical protein